MQAASKGVFVHPKLFGTKDNPLHSIVLLHQVESPRYHVQSTKVSRSEKVGTERKKLKSFVWQAFFWKTFQVFMR